MSVPVRTNTTGAMTGVLDKAELVAGSDGTTPRAISTDATGQVNVVVPAGATSIAKAEDAAHATGEVGAFVLGVRNDANAARSGTDGDYTPIAVDGAGSVITIGNIASDTADAGAPVKVGGIYRADATAAMTTGDRTNLLTDNQGRLRVVLDIGDQVTTTSSVSVSGGDADNQAQSLNLLNVKSRGYVYDGALWDRQRSADADNASAIGSTSVGGTNAHDSPIAGNPVNIGGRASAAVPTVVSADGDVVRAWCSTSGHQYVGQRPIVDTNSAAASRVNGATAAVGDLGRFSSVTLWSQVTVVGDASGITVILECDPQGGGTFASLISNSHLAAVNARVGNLSIQNGGTENNGDSVLVPGGTYRVRFTYTDGGADPTIGFIVVGK